MVLWSVHSAAVASASGVGHGSRVPGSTGMSVRVASLCTWAKPGRDSPPSLQLAALWGHIPRALGGRGLDLGAFSLLRPADSCSPWVPPSTREGERSQTPCIPELRREGPVRLGEVTISASREGRSLAQIWPLLLPTTGPHMASARNCGWGETNVMGTAPGLAGGAPAQRQTLGGRFGLGIFPCHQRKVESTAGRHCLACGCGAGCGQREMQADRGFM